MSSNTTYLITGASRGLGKGLVARYLALSGTVVIAAIRDTSHESARSLSQLPKGEGSHLIVVEMDVGSVDSIQGAIKKITESHGIKVLDTVISNAGVGDTNRELVETPISVIQKHIDVNAYGPLEVFKATLPLLRQSSKPKFCTITSVGGSFALMNTTLPASAYGASKALANYFMKWLGEERRGVITWAMHPGFVATDMGNSAAQGFSELGIDLSEMPAMTVEDSVTAMAAVIDHASLGETNGKFLGPDGNVLPW